MELICSKACLQVHITTKSGFFMSKTRFDNPYWEQVLLNLSSKVLQMWHCMYDFFIEDYPLSAHYFKILMSAAGFRKRTGQVVVGCLYTACKKRRSFVGQYLQAQYDILPNKELMVVCGQAKHLGCISSSMLLVSV